MGAHQFVSNAGLLSLYPIDLPAFVVFNKLSEYLWRMPLDSTIARSLVFGASIFSGYYCYTTEHGKGSLMYQGWVEGFGVRNMAHSARIFQPQ